MTPVGRAIILQSIPRSELVPAMNWFTMPAQLGPLLGAPLAGVILAVADWRWIFVINLPIGALGALAVFRFVSNERTSDTRDFDFPGYLLAASALILLIGSAEVASISGWSRSLAAALLGAIFSGVLFVRHARRCEHTVLDVRLFADSAFRTSMVGGSLARIAVGASPLLLPLLLQIGLGWTPLQTGYVFMGQALGTLLAKAAATILIRRFTLKTVLIGSNLAAGLANMVPALYGFSTPIWVVVVLMIATGLARSTQFTLNNTAAFSDLHDKQLAGASTLTTVIQQSGHALGISLGGLLLAWQATSGAPLRPDDFTMPFVLTGLLGLTASVLYFQLHANAGEKLRGGAPTNA